MGCSHSSSTRSQVDPTAVGASGAVQSSREQPRPDHPTSSTSSSTSIVPVGSRPVNAPLAFPRSWNSFSQIWTSSKLASERAAFFETRVSGNAQIWAAVSLAVSMARDEGDLGGAQAILEASGCVVPTGYLADGIWDETGVLYKLPRWVVSDPVNIASEHNDDAALVGTQRYDSDLVERQRSDSTENCVASAEAHTREHPTETVTHTGKGKITAVALGSGEGRAGKAKLKLRLSDRGTDVLLMVDPETTHVKDIVMMARNAANIPLDTRVSLAFMGKLLEVDSSLKSYGWKENCVISCLVFA